MIEPNALSDKAAGRLIDPFAGRRIRFGIVGCGAIGPTHAGAIAQIPDAEVTAVADVIPQRATDLAGRLNIPRVHRDETDLLNDPDIDAVCLCTPSGMHGRGAVAAMRAGKHVVVEKPMEITTAACLEMLAVQKETGKTLAVICQHRFDSASVKVKSLIDTGALGRLILITADVKWWRTQQYYDSGDWRGTWAMDGGGAVMNQGIHTLDLMQWLAGDVKTVYAQTRTGGHTGIEVEDAAVATLGFAGGAIGTFVATTAAFDGQPVRIDLFGTEGSATIEGDRLKEVKLKSGQAVAVEAAVAHAISVARGGTASVAAEPTQRVETAVDGAVWGDAHRAQLRDFIRALRTGSRPLVDGNAGYGAVKAILAMYESARTGNAVTMEPSGSFDLSP